MNRLSTALSRHVRFYIALACGTLATVIAHFAGVRTAGLLGGDVFYLVFMALCAVMIAGQTAKTLKRRAKSEDEGVGVVILVTLATMGYFCAAVFVALNKKHGMEATPLALAVGGAVLGWFSLQTVMAFHYADIHYFDDPDIAGDEKDLEFPGGRDPGPWDFLYYAFVVGMTCQVSDVQVTTTPMRRATLIHGVIAFFFNTVFIAMAVNAGVALAS